MVSANILTSKARAWPVARFLFTGLVIVVTLFLMLYKLSDYPLAWYDEGSHLHVAKNFALHGVYADSSSEGYRAFGPAVGVGPTVMLPIALLFRFFGVSIPLARLLVVAYSLLTLLLVYIIVLRLSSWPYALLAVMLLLGTTSIRYLYYSRTVVGEVPGLFFLLLGLMLWLRPRGRSVPALFGVGILIGLACITKNQYAFFILPALLLCWIADLVWYKRRGWKYFVIPGIVSGVMFAAWLYIVIIKLGQGGNFADNLATLRTAGMGALIVIDEDSIPRVATLLTSSSLYGGLFIPSFLYAILTSLQRDEGGQRRGILAIFLLVSTALFLVSLGWDRYAFGPVVFSVFFLVLFIRDLVTVITNDKTPLWHMDNDQKVPIPLIISVLFISWFVIALLVPFYGRFREVTTSDNSDSYQMADWVKANIPPTALVETWEQEMGVLTDNNLHYPPQLILAYSVADEWQNGQAASAYYDFREYNPEYLIVGPFAVYTQIYPEDRLKNYEVIKEFGAYKVYRRIN